MPDIPVGRAGETGYRGAMAPIRRCSRPSCQRQAVSTLTYVYADSTAVLGPLATYAEPHSYDLCEQHAERLTAPRGWEVVRLPHDPQDLQPSQHDLQSLAAAVRSAAGQNHQPNPVPTEVDQITVAQKGHLRVLRPVE